MSVHLHNISEKTAAVRIIKLDIKMFHHESWKLFYFGDKRSKGQGYECQKRCRRGVVCTLVSADFFEFV